MIRYESNVIFFPLYARLGLVAVPVQALVDLGFMALITVVVSGSLNFGYAGTIAMVFALLHLDAYRNNRKFVRISHKRAIPMGKIFHRMRILWKNLYQLEIIL